MFELPDGLMTTAFGYMTDLFAEFSDIIAVIVAVGLGMGAIALLVRMFIGNK